MANANDHEQFQLELINRARLDPQGESARLGVGLNQGLAGGTISGDPKQPLVFDGDLIDAARGHSRWMLDRDIFSHTGQGGSNPGDRMRAAGYDFTGNWTWGENIAYQGTTGSLPVTQFTEATYEGLFESPGHRTNLLGEAFQEVGLGVLTGDFQGYNSVMVTQNFARSGQKLFVTGVAYDDDDGDDFYSPGEGRGGISVEIDGAGSASTATTSSGGYQQEVQAGQQVVTFSGAGLARPLSVEVTLAAENVKLDLVDGRVVQSSVDAVMGANLEALVLLGAADLRADGNGLDNEITGNRGDNRLDGKGGDDTFLGGEGDDVLIGGNGVDVALYRGPQADYRVTTTNQGTTVRDLTGGEGVDQLTAIEQLRFSDGVLDISLPGNPQPQPPAPSDPEPEPEQPPVAEEPEPEPEQPPVAEEPEPEPAPEPPVAEEPEPEPEQPPVAEEPEPEPEQPPVAEEPEPEPAPEPPVAEEPEPEPEQPPVAEEPEPEPELPPIAEEPEPAPEPPAPEPPAPETPVAEGPDPVEDPVPGCPWQWQWAGGSDLPTWWTTRIDFGQRLLENLQSGGRRPWRNGRAREEREADTDTQQDGQNLNLADLLDSESGTLDPETLDRGFGCGRGGCGDGGRDFAGGRWWSDPRAEAEFEVLVFVDYV